MWGVPPFKISGARKGRFPRKAQPSDDHVAVGNLAAADDAIIAFANDVDEPVALADEKRESGMALHEARQLGKNEGAGQGRMYVEAEQAADLGPGERRFRVVDFGQDRLAALIVDLAFQRRRDLAGGPLQETYAKAFLKLLNRGGGGGAWNPEV